MDNKLEKLTSKLENLRLLCTKKIEELQSIETDCQAVEKLLRKSQSSTGTDSRENELRKDNKFTILTHRKYCERITKMKIVKAGNYIDIQYLVNKSSTWRKGYNLLKLQE